LTDFLFYGKMKLKSRKLSMGASSNRKWNNVSSPELMLCAKTKRRGKT
jgi:hypothetical protein